MPAPDAALLELADIRKSFGAVEVLRGISLTVGRNEFLTLLGPSGSGKTTVLRMIGGFETPDSGALSFEGRDILHLPINRRPFNTVFQDYALFAHMTVRQNVGYGLRVRGIDKATIAARVDEVLGTVGLHAFGARYPAEISGGQKQRVALARAIICEPRLILLDEPLAALDVELRAQMRRFLKDLQRRLGIAFVFVTHDQEEAITMSDRIIVMRDGAIEQTGAPLDLYYRPASRFVAAFFGDNNLIPGLLARLEPARCTVMTALGPLACEPVGIDLEVGRPVLVAVRPENMTFADADADIRVPCVVADVQFSGPNVLVRARPEAVPAAELTVRALSGRFERYPAPGEKIAIGWRAGDATIVPDEADHG
jgi:ABC-type Fe3+/spermidine/putrescine transport system ATPase subunit